MGPQWAQPDNETGHEELRLSQWPNEVPVMRGGGGGGGGGHRIVIKMWDNF